MSSDLLFEASKDGRHRDRGHIYKGFRRANKHKPRKLKFSSDEEVDCPNDEKEVDLQKKKNTKVMLLHQLLLVVVKSRPRSK